MSKEDRAMEARRLLENPFFIEEIKALQRAFKDELMRAELGVPQTLVGPTAKLMVLEELVVHLTSIANTTTEPNKRFRHPVA